jgi:hypothetical protein
MKLITSISLQILLLILAISLVSSASDENNNAQEVSEEIVQAINQPVAFSAAIHSVCRSGYRLSSAGRCRKILGVTTTTPQPT